MKKALILSAALAGLVGVAHADQHEAKKADKKGAAPVAEATGECTGVNACKGKGACGGDGHECAGKNSCKGKGWVSLTEKECTAKKGTWKAATAHTDHKAPEAKK